MNKPLLNTPPRGAPVVPLFGIAEWYNYYLGNEPGIDDPHVIDECIDAHLTLGISRLVWEVGRATVNYCSDLPNTTRQWELGQSPGKLRRGISRTFVLEVMKQCCPLRRAIGICRGKGVPLIGRLSMSRHYGDPANIGSTSRFSIEHPEWRETGKLGEPIVTRMCYAIPEVQQERLDILLEVQRIGVDGLLLDYCRQMPVLAYHDALVRPYIEKTGIDPRSIDTTNPDDYADWFQYRADVLTGFMRRVREAVREQERTLGRRCPIIARVPDYTRWMMIACGLDIERWFAEDLIDATMLSPFPRLRDDLKGYPEYHVAAAHKHGKLCIGGVGSQKLIMSGKRDNPNVPIEYACKVAADQYQAGADAMSLYQSESLCRRDYLKDFIRHLGDREWIVRACAGVETPQPDHEHFYVGKDWHARLETEGLGTAVCGNLAL